MIPITEKKIFEDLIKYLTRTNMIINFTIAASILIKLKVFIKVP